MVAGLMPNSFAALSTVFMNSARIAALWGYCPILTTDNVPIACNQLSWEIVPMTKKTFLELLRERIDSDSDLTEAGLAKKADLDNSTIRNMFARNTSPRIGTIEKICAALGETVETFMSSDLTKEERTVHALMRQMPLDHRRQLLGYAQALSEQPDQSQQE